MVGIVRRLAKRLGLFDIPNQRSSHTQATPRGGGLPITILTLSAAVWHLASGEFSPVLAAYVVGAFLIALVSWLDDVRRMSRLLRISFHFLAALLVVGAVLLKDPRPSLNVFIIVAVPVVLTWVVGFTNIFNFMDGIDGLAGGQALVSGLWWAAVAIVSGNPVLLWLSLAIAASSIGFLLHNWSPARIFMGDVGSAFLGYTFAVFPLISGDPVNLRLWCGGILTVWPFAFDGAVTVIRRLLRNENIFEAHRQHIYQRLVRLGWSHQAVALLYVAFAAISSVSGLVAALGGPLVAAVLPASLGFAIFFWVYRLERRSAGIAAVI